MRVEIRCPECSNAWLVDESARAGEMLCPRCMSRIALGPTTTNPVVPAAETGSIDIEPPKAPEPPRQAESKAASPSDPPVVCPRCKLHFVPKHDEPAAPSSRWTALIVEDLDYFRRIAADSLSSRFEVLTAKDSDEARRALARNPVDLIVLDLTLDGRDGGKQLLRELDPKPCPILIFTAQDESDLYGEYWQALTELGADDLVIKGMKVGESLLRKALELVGAPVEEEPTV